MNKEIIELVHHIFQARVDLAKNHKDFARAIAYQNAIDIFDYALAENYECLKEFDYLMTNEDIRRKNEEGVAENETW